MVELPLVGRVVIVWLVCLVGFLGRLEVDRVARLFESVKLLFRLGRQLFHSPDGLAIVLQGTLNLLGRFLVGEDGLVGPVDFSPALVLPNRGGSHVEVLAAR